VFRTVLRAVGLLFSLISFATLMTARSPDGGPSPLERVPALMDALQARVAAREAGLPATPVVLDAPAEPRPRLPTLSAPSRPPEGMAGAPLTGEPAPSHDPALPAADPTWGLPGGSGAVKVNRGLP